MWIHIEPTPKRMGLWKLKGKSIPALRGDGLRPVKTARVQRGLNRDLGFDERDRIKNVRRIAHVAKMFVEAYT